MLVTSGSSMSLFPSLSSGSLQHCWDLHSFLTGLFHAADPPGCSLPTPTRFSFLFISDSCKFSPNFLSDYLETVWLCSQELEASNQVPVCSCKGSITEPDDASCLCPRSDACTRLTARRVSSPPAVPYPDEVWGLWSAASRMNTSSPVPAALKSSLRTV